MREKLKLSLTTSLFVFLVFLTIFNPVIIGQISPGEKDVAKYLLGRIKESRNKVENYKFKVVYQDYTPKEVLQRQIETFKKKLQGKLPEKQLQQMIKRVSDSEEYKFQKHVSAFDREGRARVEIVFGISDSKGSLTNETSKLISTWDGKNSIEYNERSGKASALLSNKQPMETSQGHRQPWYTFGGNFYKYFIKTISDGNPIDVKKEEDGTYRVELFYAENRKRVGIVDPSQGFSVILHESYGDGRLVARYKAKFSEVYPNVWFPIEGEIVAFTADSMSRQLGRQVARVSEIVINNPNFYEGLFHIDFPEGTVVRDAISGYQYVVGEPMSEKPDGSSKSLHEVAMDTLEEMAKDNQKHQEVELFIPKDYLALKKK